MEDLNYTIKQCDLIDIARTKTDHMLGHKINLQKCIEVIKNMFFDQN